MTVPLLMLPGMMCDARLFSPQIAALSGQRAIQLAPIGGHDNVADLAAEVLAHAPERFALMGLSMGGIVAMEVLRQAPQRVAGIALLDTNPLAEAEAVQARRGPQIDRVRAGELLEVMRDDMTPNYLMPGPNAQAALDLCMDMAMGLGPAVFERQSLALRDRPDQSHTLRTSRVPSLILCGEHDALCPVARHQLMLQLMPHAQLHVIAQAAHLPTLEQPNATNAAVSGWLQQI